MQKKFEKGTENYELFNDFWQLRQNYYEPDYDDSWFEELRMAGEKITNKFKGTELEKLARNLVLSHLEDVEDRWKERKKHE